MPPKGSTKCKDCKGTGNMGDIDGECAHCHGKGYTIDGECEHNDPAAVPLGETITAGEFQTMVQEHIAAIAEKGEQDNLVLVPTPSADSAQEAPEPVEIRGWGWWTAYDKQREWIAEVERHIPFPDEKCTHGLSDIQPSELSARLQVAGGALAYLHAQQGLLEGRAHALKEVFENGMNAAKGRIPATAKLTTEAAKEAYVFNMSDIGEALRETKRRHIEIETCIKSQAGLIKAYTAAWETISRVLTATLGELSLATGRGN